ncbi:hypothetical protein CGRA01v4_02961 [Colletotrichum graminicola]|nr:hypothetical protein CGRA01v4_02961 [Colletotrichum graminicola]
MTKGTKTTESPSSIDFPFERKRCPNCLVWTDLQPTSSPRDTCVHWCLEHPGSEIVSTRSPQTMTIVWTKSNSFGSIPCGNARPQSFPINLNLPPTFPHQGRIGSRSSRRLRQSASHWEINLADRGLRVAINDRWLYIAPRTVQGPSRGEKKSRQVLPWYSDFDLRNRLPSLPARRAVAQKPGSLSRT